MYIIFTYHNINFQVLVTLVLVITIVTLVEFIAHPKGTYEQLILIMISKKK